MAEHRSPETTTEALSGKRRRDDARTGVTRDAIQRAFLDNLFYVQGRFPDVASTNDNYCALSYTVRDRLMHRWIASARTYKRDFSRTVCYFSAEYLPGPHLANNLLNLGIEQPVREAMDALGLDLDELIEHEVEPGLGNGGLGRLAACFMDSLATLQVPTIGYGIRYEFGIFEQLLRDGWQVEGTDSWLRDGNPWALDQAHVRLDVKIGGHTEHYTDETGRLRVRWIPADVIRGLAHDTPIPGYGVANANFLRLWSAEAAESFDLAAFNRGNYSSAVQQKISSETVSKVLYPNDEPESGKRLRLIQQHFFVSCSLQDMLRIYKQSNQPLERFCEKYVVQLNDTHPAIAVAELMRLLVDEHGIPWKPAWDITKRTFAYTNHTLLPEALEKWPVPLFASVLPRHLEIIYEINHHFLAEVRMRRPHDEAKAARMSIIDETDERYVRMAHLACVGSFAINGVASLHTQLLRETVLRDFHELWPHKIRNKTNGVTPRRFLMLVNPRLAELIDGAIGTAWRRDLERLRDLEPFAADAEYRARWRRIKKENKRALAQYVRARTSVDLDRDSLFDVQVKRIHEYKRQHLNVLHIVTLYDRLKRNPAAPIAPRTFIFGGKAAPGYFMAKLIIKLVNSIAEVVNHDPDIDGRLKVVFVSDFSVKVGRRIYPAADLSEQISTAGKEASGTGSMKFALNGALTIGTLDGANIEIREAVGPENFFLFGLTADEVAERRRGGYRPCAVLDNDPELQGVLDLIGRFFSHGDRNLFRPLIDDLIARDEYMVLADYHAYVACQEQVSRAWTDAARWDAMSILNVARMGRFSSDRTVAEYCEDIWHVQPTPVEVT
jgi:starch phosphorylase